MILMMIMLRDHHHHHHDTAFISAWYGMFVSVTLSRGQGGGRGAYRVYDDYMLLYDDIADHTKMKVVIRSDEDVSNIRIITYIRSRLRSIRYAA